MTWRAGLKFLALTGALVAVWVLLGREPKRAPIGRIQPAQHARMSIPAGATKHVGDMTAADILAQPAELAAECLEQKERGCPYVNVKGCVEALQRLGPKYEDCLHRAERVDCDDLTGPDCSPFAASNRHRLPLVQDETIAERHGRGPCVRLNELCDDLDWEACHAAVKADTGGTLRAQLLAMNDCTGLPASLRRSRP